MGQSGEFLATHHIAPGGLTRPPYLVRLPRWESSRWQRQDRGYARGSSLLLLRASRPWSIHFVDSPTPLARVLPPRLEPDLVRELEGLFNGQNRDIGAGVEPGRCRPTGGKEVHAVSYRAVGTDQRTGIGLRQGSWSAH